MSISDEYVDKNQQIIKRLAYCLFVAADRAIEKANEMGRDVNRGQFLALIRSAFEEVLQVLPEDKDIQKWISLTKGQWSEIPHQRVGGTD